jgi:hypothetical protein
VSGARLHSSAPFSNEKETAMKIRFLRDRTVEDHEGTVVETFKSGEEKSDLSPESAMGHVRRGYAAFVRAGGKLYDHEDRLVSGPPAKRQRAPAGSRPARERAGAPRALAGGHSGKVAGNVRRAAAAVKRDVSSRANLAKSGK